jgi:hypothetical protein
MRQNKQTRIFLKPASLDQEVQCLCPLTWRQLVLHELHHMKVIWYFGRVACRGVQSIISFVFRSFNCITQANTVHIRVQIMLYYGAVFTTRSLQ